MAGIYIHIPYCKQACVYCDFHFSTTHKNKASLIQCICAELKMRKDVLGGEIIDTIYFGGGTPSICSIGELQSIIDTIYHEFSVSDSVEITLEANPDDLSTEKLTELKSIGMHRLSIGIQSFFEEDLKWMHRAHTSEEAKRCLKESISLGFTNVNADLIFASPGLTDEKLIQNLTLLTDLGIPHLSCYNLTIEERTQLHHQVKTLQIAPISDESAIRQFYLIREFLQARGYEHYEISNYAKPGAYSRHNTAYWQSKKYLGVGPSAHSYDGDTRSWNIRNNENYIKQIQKGEWPGEVEILTPSNRYNEYILTGLRTQWGIQLKMLETEFSNEYQSQKSQFETYLNDQKLLLRGNQLIINPDYLIMADSIASELFII